MTREDDKPHQAPALSPEVIEKLIVQTSSYGMSANEYLDRLLEREREETIAGIKRGLESMRRGEGRPAEEAFDELFKEFGIPNE